MGPGCAGKVCKATKREAHLIKLYEYPAQPGHSGATIGVKAVRTQGRWQKATNGGANRVRDRHPNGL